VALLRSQQVRGTRKQRTQGQEGIATTSAVPRPDTKENSLWAHNDAQSMGSMHTTPWHASRGHQDKRASHAANCTRMSSSIRPVNVARTRGIPAHPFAVCIQYTGQVTQASRCSWIPCRPKQSPCSENRHPMLDAPPPPLSPSITTLPTPHTHVVLECATNNRNPNDNTLPNQYPPTTKRLRLPTSSLPEPLLCILLRPGDPPPAPQ
jgi:hypothetical protein